MAQSFSIPGFLSAVHGLMQGEEQGRQIADQRDQQQAQNVLQAAHEGWQQAQQSYQQQLQQHQGAAQSISQIMNEMGDNNPDSRALLEDQRNAHLNAINQLQAPDFDSFMHQRLSPYLTGRLAKHIAPYVTALHGARAQQGLPPLATPTAPTPGGAPLPTAPPMQKLPQPSVASAQPTGSAQNRAQAQEIPIDTGGGSPLAQAQGGQTATDAGVPPINLPGATGGAFGDLDTSTGTPFGGGAVAPAAPPAPPQVAAKPTGTFLPGARGVPFAAPTVTPSVATTIGLQPPVAAPAQVSGGTPATTPRGTAPTAQPTAATPPFDTRGLTMGDVKTYRGNFAKNSAYAKPGPYTTQLTPADEGQFQRWFKTTGLNPSPDYDYRGFWKAQVSGNPEAQRDGATGHFPDTWKTPFHESFSNESQYAKPNAPHWEGDKLVPTQPALTVQPTGQPAPAPTAPPKLAADVVGELAGNTKPGGQLGGTAGTPPAGGGGAQAVSVPDPVVPEGKKYPHSLGGVQYNTTPSISQDDRNDYKTLVTNLSEAASRAQTTPEQRKVFARYVAAAKQAAKQGVSYQDFEDANPSLGLYGMTLAGPKPDQKEAKVVEGAINRFQQDLRAKPLPKEEADQFNAWLQANPAPTDFSSEKSLENARAWHAAASAAYGQLAGAGNLRQHAEQDVQAGKRAQVYVNGYNAAFAPSDKNPPVADETLPTLLPALLQMETDSQGKDNLILPRLGFHATDIGEIKSLMDQAKAETDPEKQQALRDQALGLAKNVRDRLRAGLTAKQEDTALKAVWSRLNTLSPQAQADPRVVQGVYNQARIGYLAPQNGQPSYRAEKMYRDTLLKLPSLAGKPPEAQKAVINDILGLAAATGHKDIPLDANTVLGLPEETKQRLAQGWKRIKLSGDALAIRKANSDTERAYLQARTTDLLGKTQDALRNGKLSDQQKAQFRDYTRQIGDIQKQIKTQSLLAAAGDPDQQVKARSIMANLRTQVEGIQGRINSLSGLNPDGSPKSTATPRTGGGGKVAPLSNGGKAAYDNAIKLFQQRHPGVAIPAEVQQQIRQQAEQAAAQGR